MHMDAVVRALTVQIGDAVFGPLETMMLGLGVALLVVIPIALWWIGRAEDRQQRLMSALGEPVSERPSRERGRRLRQLGVMIARSPISGAAKRAKYIQVLNAAGFRGPTSLTTFLAVKLGCSAALLLLCWLAFQFDLWTWEVLLPGPLAGWMLPDIILGRLAVRRRRRIEAAIPDAIDLLVICAGAGLSLSQAIEEIGHDLRDLSPDVADEFATTATEMRVLSDRTAALENLGKRTGLASLRNMIATLNQSIKFGTPLSESLRVFAAEMRLVRIARLEERAARLPVLLTLPLVGLIIPSLTMLIATPVALRVIDRLSTAFPQLF